MTFSEKSPVFNLELGFAKSKGIHWWKSLKIVVVLGTAVMKDVFFVDVVNSKTNAIGVLIIRVSDNMSFCSKRLMEGYRVVPKPYQRLMEEIKSEIESSNDFYRTALTVSSYIIRTNTLQGQSLRQELLLKQKDALQSQRKDCATEAFPILKGESSKSAAMEKAVPVADAAEKVVRSRPEPAVACPREPAPPLEEVLAVEEAEVHPAPTQNISQTGRAELREKAKSRDKKLAKKRRRETTGGGHSDTHDVPAKLVVCEYKREVRPKPHIALRSSKFPWHPVLELQVRLSEEWSLRGPLTRRPQNLIPQRFQRK